VVEKDPQKEKKVLLIACIALRGRSGLRVCRITVLVEGRVFPFASIGRSPPLFCCPTVQRGRWPMGGYPFREGHLGIGRRGA